MLTAIGPLAIDNIAIGGNNPGDFGEVDDCGNGPSSGQSCNMTVTFKPTQANTRTATITISTNGYFNNGAVVITLTGYGTAIAYAPNPIGFNPTKGNTTSMPKAETITNKGTTALVMGTASTTGDFQVVSGGSCVPGYNVPPLGGKCTILVAYKPTKNGAEVGSLIINDSDGSSPQIVKLTGTGIGATLAPNPVKFPGVQLDGTTSTAKPATLTNYLSTTLNIQSAVIGGANAGDFAIAAAPATTCGNSLVGNSNCAYEVTFTPSQAGAEAATLTVTDDDGVQVINLTGTGTIVKLSPTSLPFGKEPPGSVTENHTTLTNVSSTIALNISHITLSDSVNYSLDLVQSTCPTTGGQVAPGGQCTVYVQFHPGGPGVYAATLTFTDDGAGLNSQQIVKLSGSE
jgi:hypothetical protein